MELSINGSRWCLFLDVDGTLLEFASTPGSVEVEPALRALLWRVQVVLRGAVALVSGRPIVELDRLFGPHRWAAAGAHGLERRDALGRWHVPHALDDPAIGQARVRLWELSQRHPGTIFEDKGVSAALHYRQVPHLEGELRRTVRDIARELGGGVQLLDGRMVLELRPPGATKADAIRAFLREPPFAGRRPIFIGDDVTDEAALAEVERAGGLSVAVGDRLHAMLRVDSPRDVRSLLEELVASGAPTG